VLRAQIGKRKSGLIFPWWSGEQSKQERRRTTSLLSRQFGWLFEAAQCADLRFHDLRHDATARLYERTTLTDLPIAKITGHKSLHQMQRYAKLRRSDLARVFW
jgi:integrase